MEKLKSYPPVDDKCPYSQYGSNNKYAACMQNGEKVYVCSETGYRTPEMACERAALSDHCNLSYGNATLCENLKKDKKEIENTINYEDREYKKDNLYNNVWFGFIISIIILLLILYYCKKII